MCVDGPSTLGILITENGWPLKECATPRRFVRQAAAEAGETTVSSAATETSNAAGAAVSARAGE
jgi:hypothetical protein